MGNTSLPDVAAAILLECREGRAVNDDLLDAILVPALGEDREAATEAGQCLFRDIVEPLADSFQLADCEAYVKLFSRVIARGVRGLDADSVEERYHDIRRRRRCDIDSRQVRHVFILSRVTLGADVAVTSIVLDAAKKRFPEADIHFVGNRKGWELFADDHRISFLPVDYQRRGTLRERLASGASLREQLSRLGTVVIDPDSRLTQLGLLPVCPADSYYFFESRAYGGDTDAALSQLAQRWVAETFGVVDAVSYIRPMPPPGSATARGVTVSLGVGENLAKRIPDPFETELLRELLKLGLPILIDEGAGGEEAERVRNALSCCGARPDQIEIWSGAFAPFAARIANSRFYVGYDSAGQHVAAACGVPLLSIFAGYPSERFYSRWAPMGIRPMAIIPAVSADPAGTIRAVREAIQYLIA